LSLTRGLSTARKISLARWLFRLVIVLRLLAGRRGTEVVCRRRRVRWSLDLREGVQFALYLGLYEGATSRRLLEFVRPGSIVVDIGANVGAHTLPLARAVGPAGRVIAVEPTDAAFERLRTNCALNPDLEDRITTVHAALGPPGGTVEAGYYSAWPLMPSGSLHPILMGAEQPAADARFFTLDDLLDSLALSPVALIKIDVDGRELDVLKGAAKVLLRDCPIVVFELCPYLLTERGHSAGDVVAFFASNGYELLDERTLRPVGTDASLIRDAIPQEGARNLVARAQR
jgi:FkbM family methyltransferase